MNRSRSFFFPLLLIAIGVLWLLVSFSIIPAANLWALTRIWPLFLIGLGLGLILRTYWSEAGLATSTVVVLAAIAAVLYAPTLGWDKSPGWGWVHVNTGGIIGAVGGSGVISSESYQVGDFDSISVRYPAEVVIHQGDSSFVEITTDDNLLPQLITEVRSGTLVIDSRERNWAQRVNASQGVKIEISVTDLKELTFDSAGSVSMDGLVSDNLSLRLNGAGSMAFTGLEVGDISIRLDGAGSLELSGSANRLDANLNGLGSLEAGSLQANDVSINLDGLGSATVRAIDTLDIDIDGLGSVNYYGSPQVSERKDGLGSVKQIGE